MFKGKIIIEMKEVFKEIPFFELPYQIEYFKSVLHKYMKYMP